MDTVQFHQCFRSLGVEIAEDKSKRWIITINPKSGSAGYSYLGIQEFAHRLGRELNAKVEIGDRVLVFSKQLEMHMRHTAFLQEAMKKGVMVWTREMIEPTISALHTTH